MYPDDEHSKEDESLLELFRSHVKEHHGILIDEQDAQTIDKGYIEEHLKGQHTFIPITAFAHKDISLLETTVKFLRENEGFKNIQVAHILRKTPASTWITYRNANRKHPDRITCTKTDMYIPTDVLSSKLSFLESVVRYLHLELRLSFRDIGNLISRDERTIWTVNNRASKKLGGEAS